VSTPFGILQLPSRDFHDPPNTPSQFRYCHVSAQTQCSITSPATLALLRFRGLPIQSLAHAARKLFRHIRLLQDCQTSFLRIF
jgi:hypothetical protein